jgi:hypothetical protein
LFALDGRRDISLKKVYENTRGLWARKAKLLHRAPFYDFSIDTLPPLTLVDLVVEGTCAGGGK